MDISSQKTDAISDTELLRQIKAGHHPAYKTIVDRYLGKLWRLAVNVLRNETEAEDVVQDVLLTVWKNREDWNEDGSATFSTWIYRVTLNRCIDQKRRRKVTVDSDTIDENIASDATPDADKQMISHQQSQNLLELLKILPENQRIAMIYCYYDDLTVKEISDKMQASEQSVRSLLKRARKALREKLESDPDYGSEKLQGEPGHLQRRPQSLARGFEEQSTDAD